MQDLSRFKLPFSRTGRRGLGSRFRTFFLVLVMLAASLCTPALRAQSQAKPAASGVRPAAPVQVPGQSVKTTVNKDYWVGKAQDGSTMGVWSQLNPDDSDYLVKFVISANAITAVSSQQDSSGAAIASAYAVLFLDQDKSGPDAARGFTHSVGPQTKENERGHGALPATVPSGLKKELLDLGVTARLAKELQNLVEARNAIDALAGAAIGNQSMPTGAMNSAFLTRGGLPEDIRSNPSAGLPGRDGRASGDAHAYPTAEDSTPGPTSSPTGPKDKYKDNGDKDKEPQPRFSDGRTSGSSDSKKLDLNGNEVRQHNRRQNSNSGSARSSPDGTPPVRFEAAVRSRNSESVIVIYTVYDPSTHAGRLVSTRVPMPGSNDPRRNPSEGGGTSGGIDSQTWQLLRGTGLGVVLYNTWLQKKDHDFGASLRQPPQDGQIGSRVREVPKVGRSAVVNPSDPNVRDGSRPKIPDLKDPTKPDEGGGRPAPRPRP